MIIKKIRSFKTDLATFFSALTILLSIYSCNPESNHVSTDVINTSGEDIFRALFFLQGDLVDKVPSLYKMKLERQAFMENPAFSSTFSEYNDFYNGNFQEVIENEINMIVEFIKDMDKTAFKSLKQAVLSKDIDQLNEELTKLTMIYETALLNNNKYLEEGLSLLELADKKGGISPDNYDLKSTEGIQQYNNDVNIFLENELGINPFSSKDQELKGTCIVFLVFAFVLVAIGAYLFLAIGGGILFFIGGFWLIHIETKWSEPVPDPIKNSSIHNLSHNLILADLIAHFE